MGQLVMDSLFIYIYNIIEYVYIISYILYIYNIRISCNIFIQREIKAENLF